MLDIYFCVFFNCYWQSFIYIYQRVVYDWSDSSQIFLIFKCLLSVFLIHYNYPIIIVILIATSVIPITVLSIIKILFMVIININVIIFTFKDFLVPLLFVFLFFLYISWLAIIFYFCYVIALYQYYCCFFCLFWFWFLFLITQHFFSHRTVKVSILLCLLVCFFVWLFALLLKLKLLGNNTLIAFLQFPKELQLYSFISKRCQHPRRSCRQIFRMLMVVGHTEDFQI